MLESRNLYQSPVIWTTLILNKNLRTWLFFFIPLFQVCIHSCWTGFSSTMLWVFLTMSTESSSWTSRVSVAGGAASSWLPSVFQLWTCQRAGLVAYNIKMPLISHNLLADKMQYNVKSYALQCFGTALLLGSCAYRHWQWQRSFRYTKCFTWNYSGGTLEWSAIKGLLTTRIGQYFVDLLITEACSWWTFELSKTLHGRVKKFVNFHPREFWLLCLLCTAFRVTPLHCHTCCQWTEHC